MIIGVPKLKILNNEFEISALINSERLCIKDFKLWYKFPCELINLVDLNSNPFVTAMLLLCLSTGEDLEVMGDMSLTLKQNMLKIVNLLGGWINTKSWEIKVSPIKINTKNIINRNYKAQGVGLFFTLGVDSFHTLEDYENKHRFSNCAISQLIFISGFDIPNSNHILLNQTRDNIISVAKSLNKKVLFVSTNLRDITDNFINWESEHGAAIASVGQMFPKILNTILISSSDANVTNSSYGTHPDLDKLWSIENLEFYNLCSKSRKI